MKRVFAIIIDGVGVGALPDAAEYGDLGSDTLGNLARAVGGLFLPNLEALGLGYIHQIPGVSRPEIPSGNFGKMAMNSPGKDSTTGHWELGGIILKQPFPTFPDGFPQLILNEFTAKTGYEILGNFAASGTEIIKQLGEKHIKTGKPIIYTSADSVFQIAAHEEIIPIKELYNLCEISREILQGDFAVARVIARPFRGKDRNNFVRTKYRKDFSVKPFGKTTLDRLEEANIATIGIGKINDLYAHEGILHNIMTKNNEEGMEALSASIQKYQSGFIMANLVDFDMLWGHRNDPKGFAGGLRKFDDWLGGFLGRLTTMDILIITSDHGNDPTTVSTDHSREYVPILIYGSQLKTGVNIGTRASFSDFNATVTDYFGVKAGNHGKSFLNLLRE